MRTPEEIQKELKEKEEEERAIYRDVEKLRNELYNSRIPEAQKFIGQHIKIIDHDTIYLAHIDNLEATRYDDDGGVFKASSSICCYYNANGDISFFEPHLSFKDVTEKAEIITKEEYDKIVDDLMDKLKKHLKK